MFFRPLPFPDPIVSCSSAKSCRSSAAELRVISAPEYADYKQLEGRTSRASGSTTIRPSRSPARRARTRTRRRGVGIALQGPARQRRARANVSSRRRRRRRAERRRAERRDLAAPIRRRHDIVGRTIGINGVPTTIIGVMPPGFAFPLTGLGSESRKSSRPTGSPRPSKDARQRVRTSLIARLAPGVTMEQAKRGASEIAGRSRRFIRRLRPTHHPRRRLLAA